jgi:hypothetical protein
MAVWDYCEENTITEYSKQVTVKLTRTVIAKYFIKRNWVSSCDVLFSTQSLLWRLVIFLHHFSTSQPSQEHLCFLKLVKDSPLAIKEWKKTWVRKRQSRCMEYILNFCKFLHIFRIEWKRTEYQFFDSNRNFYVLTFLVRWRGFVRSWYVRCSNRSSLMKAFVCGCYLSFFTELTLSVC